MQLFDTQGQRLYLTESERKGFSEAATEADRDIRTFCMALAYSDCRISEALTLVPSESILNRSPYALKP